MDIEVKDDYLDGHFWEQLEHLFTANPSCMRWSFGDVVDDSCFEGNPLDNFQFSHMFYQAMSPVSPHWNDIIDPFNWITKDLPIEGLLKMKANINPRHTEVIRHGFHIDVPFVKKELHGDLFKTGILYMNTNNGYTELEDGTKVESVANRLLIFPAHMKHSGTTCTDQEFRCVLNFTYF